MKDTSLERRKTNTDFKQRNRAIKYYRETSRVKIDLQTNVSAALSASSNRE
jgi:hypothetical protein